MKINCDLGESFGAWSMGQDEIIMPQIDMANIACGFHASDPLIISNTLALAKKNNVLVGAHPSYPDLVGFGRRSMKMANNELISLIHYQVSALLGMASIHGLTLNYVKPHGALYNDMMKDSNIFTTVCQAVSQIPATLKLVIQAIPNNDEFIAIAQQFQVPLLFEAFADRNYQDNGLLVPRSESNAIITSVDDIKSRSLQLKESGSIPSTNGKELTMKIDTLCIHGDHPHAGEIAVTLRQVFND